MFRCLCASCFAVGLKKAEEGAEKDCCAFKRRRGHVSKVSACLVSTNSPLTKLLGPQWRVKWFGNKERLALPLFLSLSLLHTQTQKSTHARTHPPTHTIVHKPEEEEMMFLVLYHHLQSVFTSCQGLLGCSHVPDSEKYNF